MNKDQAIQKLKNEVKMLSKEELVTLYEMSVIENASLAEDNENLEAEVEKLKVSLHNYESGNLPTWKSEYDIIKSACDEVDKNNQELRSENIKLKALIADPNLEQWYLKSENLRMVCIRLSRAKTLEKRDQVANQCKHLFADVRDILRNSSEGVGDVSV